MHHAVPVGVIEPAAGLGDDLERLVDAEVASVAQQFGARVAGHVLHHDEVLMVAGVEAEIEHLDDVGVHEPGGGEGLPPEPRDERGVVGEMFGQQLDRDVALEPVIEREMDGRHPTDPEAAFDPIPTGDRRRARHCPFWLAPPPVVSPAPPLDVVPVAGGFVAVLVDVDVLLVVGGGVWVVV